ncbi:hypothetical protein EIP86_009362 [Pleurotus ostreatoroseus]|nr:hypothetical protein EIP86_009362 [Pleurotus ostreatoroseus]
MAYVHMNNCDTQVVVTDLLGIPNLQPLLGVDYIAIGTGKEQLDWPPQRMSYAPCKLFCASGRAPHILKAQEAEYPPDRALLKDMFMNMSNVEVYLTEQLVNSLIDSMRRDMWKLMEVLIAPLEDELELLGGEPDYAELADMWYNWLKETYSKEEATSSQKPGPHQNVEGSREPVAGNAPSACGVELDTGNL